MLNYIYSKFINAGRIVKWNIIHGYGLVHLLKCLDNQKAKLFKRLRNGEKINILFLLQYPEMWNSEKSVYEAFIKDNRFKVIILTIPKQVGVRNKESQFMDINESSIFCRKNGLEYVEARENGEWVNIKSLCPDFIFVQRTYDECMPPKMSLKKLSESGILCYIPYGYDFNDIHFPIEYNINFFNNVGCFFADSSDSYAYVKNKYKIDSVVNARECFDLGFPRFDLCNSIKEDNEFRKTSLWIPRWSLDEANDKSGFFDYLDILIDYYKAHQELFLIIRPHPLMFKNFVELGVMTEAQVEDLFARLGRIPNIQFDANADYLESFDNSDYMICDFSSLMIEYFYTLKPIIFCGKNVDRYTHVGKEMMDGVIKISDGKELIAAINNITKGDYEFYERNKRIIESNKSSPMKVGEKIKTALLDTYCVS